MSVATIVITPTTASRVKTILLRTGPPGASGTPFPSPTPPEDTTRLWLDTIDNTLVSHNGSVWVTGSELPPLTGEEEPLPDGAYFTDELGNFIADSDGIIFAEPV